MSEIIAFKSADEREFDEYRKSCRMAAKSNKILFDEHVAVGFTEDQAMQILVMPQTEFVIE
jgi:hypothetical protein